MPTNKIDRCDLSRRQVLALSSISVVAIAGCSSSDDDPSGDDSSEGSDSSDETDESANTDGDDDQSESEDNSDEESEQEEEEPEQEDEQETVEPASFEVVSVDHPDEVSTGESHTFAITVENTGGEDGTFEEILEISVEGVAEWENVGTIQLEVPAGETATWESEPVDFDDPGTLQFRLGEFEWSYSVTITEPEPQSFSGSGQSVEQGIDIEGGLVVVEGSHDGERNFQVSLEGDSEFGEGFINVIGQFDGAQAALVDEGEYILDVTADGSWDVTIRQPRSGDGDSLPTSFAGTGPDVVGPVQFSGTGVATGEHDGERNFQVRIYPMTGSFGEGVFNEIGQFEGETTFSFNGIGWVDVNADGSWELELE